MPEYLFEDFDINESEPKGEKFYLEGLEGRIDSDTKVILIFNPEARDFQYYFHNFEDDKLIKENAKNPETVEIEEEKNGFTVKGKIKHLGFKREFDDILALRTTDAGPFHSAKETLTSKK